MAGAPTKHSVRLTPSSFPSGPPTFFTRSRQLLVQDSAQVGLRNDQSWRSATAAVRAHGGCRECGVAMDQGDNVIRRLEQALALTTQALGLLDGTSADVIAARLDHVIALLRDAIESEHERARG